MTITLDQSPAWLALQQHWDGLKNKRLGDIVLGDADRLDACTIGVKGLSLNFALHYVVPQTLNLLEDLAAQQGLAAWRDKMWRGEKINSSEKRAVLHIALRQQNDMPVMVDGEDIIPHLRLAQQGMRQFVTNVRDGRWRGATGKAIKHVINLGIGGSDLGPRAVVQALQPFTSGPRVHFVANADAFDLFSALHDLDPAETLFVIVSKTFTTQETLLNAQTARRWIADALGDSAVKNHFVAVSTSLEKVKAFGIPEENIFPLWDWVGGRTSLWSTVGLSAALALGMAHFDQLLAGAAAMDEHFHSAPLQKNLPAMLGLLGVWNRNFIGCHALAVLPYAERLREMPRYLQQLDMESNGKSVTRDGTAVTYATAPIVFGECGTVGQHSFHQWLHQGSEIVAADFICVRTDDLNAPTHHRAMLTNMAAQAGALAFGQTKNVTAAEYHQGGRPSTLLMMDRLDPYHMGLLLALYEHKIFTQGIIWSLNSYDQPGVELGKKLARRFDHPSSAPDPKEQFLNKLLGSMT